MTNRRPMFKRLITLAACVAAMAAAGPGIAQTAHPKISADLAALIGSTAQPSVTWANQVGGQLHAKVLVVASSGDASLAALRQAILAQGGSVYYVSLSVRALAALVPVAGLDALAARGDVLAIAPNRAVVRSGSLVADGSGASAVPPLGGVTAVNGAGVGIAVLDSGIDWDHRSLKDAFGRSRVAQAVDIVGLSKKINGNGWTRGKDSSDQVAKSLRVGDKLVCAKAPDATLPDPYGHGTHVASIAAGAGSYQQPDSSGLAPGATLYDVRVLDEKGIGNMMDLLAGIDWVVQRARGCNIRVMNLSLAANSTDSFIVDPLARAARSATASGLVVVAAAGNAGKNGADAEVYGAIGSPGHEPSVITVGAANAKATALRSDDLMTRFSSRGPTRGSVKLPSGSTWTDNLLKPDLVASGNRLLGAVANQQNQPAPTGNLLATLNPALMQGASDLGASQALNQELMHLSGTSVSAPAVAGAAALMLQANPGLTPPLVKAILQYTAQPLAGANLLQQGAG
jgi:serine protease AprX